MFHNTDNKRLTEKYEEGIYKYINLYTHNFMQSIYILITSWKIGIQASGI